MNTGINIKDNTEYTKEELAQILKKKQEILKELEKIGKNSDYMKELSEIALIQLQLEQYVDSETNYKICLNHFKLQKDRLGQASVYGILGTLFFKKGDYLKSIENYEKAYKISEELMQYQEQIVCLKGIGTSLIKLNRLEEACNIFFDCCALCSDNDDIYNLLDCLGNLIFIHEKEGKWDVVFELYKKTLKAFKELKDMRGLITSYFNLGILKKRDNNFLEALRYFQKGTNIAIDSNYGELIIKGLGYVGESFFHLGKLKEAKNQYIKALYLANKIRADNAKTQLNVILQSLGLSENQIQEELKNYKENRNKIS
jgi:tetratricopeptide (TPR) repeat protein